MPIQTNLSSSPYFDDFDDTKNYYKVLFKPGVAVQVREINQLQRILQDQIEKFGDNIFKRGTIIDGCNFTFLDKLSYAKLLDNETSGAPVNVSTFKNYYVKDNANLVGVVVDTANGFESTTPDLNTIFVRFINSGNTFTQTKFTKNTILEVYNSNNVVERIVVNNGGTDFANTDDVIITSAVAVQNSSGGKTFDANTWVLNTIIRQDTTDARAEILEVNSTANSEALILKIRPLETDLTNSQSTISLWTFQSGFTITSNNFGATTANASANGLVVGLAGTGAAGSLLTDSTGKIITITVTSDGVGYYVPPHVSVFSNTGTVASLNLESQSYLAKVTIQNDDAATGNSYGVVVGDGIIYQKGHFVKVDQQVKIVEKYANTSTPDEKVVGFDTTETFVDYNEDPSLLDNALGTFNFTAPGADRLKLTPSLVVLSTSEADANTDFLPVIEFNKGKPFRQLRTTQYNKIQDEISLRTLEESGNFVVDKFNSTTSSPSTTSEANTFDVIIDPGIAYINGERVETLTSYIATLNKGIDNTSFSDVSIDLNYGNYLRINEVGGYFKFNTGDTVEFYNTAQLYISNTNVTGTQLSPVGTKIGEARMKSLVLETGTPGSSAIYKLYLFDIKMATGYNFSEVRSVYYNGATYKGYGDAVLEPTGPSNANVAVLKLPDSDKLLFSSGYTAVANLSGIDYRYRSSNTSTTIATNGNVSIGVATGTLPYIGELSSIERSEVIVTPLANLETANVSTCHFINTNNIISFANSTFFNYLRPGDYVKIYGSASSKIRRITGISSVAANGTANAFSLSLNSIVDLVEAANTSANVSFILPTYVPVDLNRAGRSANVSGTTLRAYIAPPVNFAAAGNVSVTYTAKRTSLAPTAKTTSRKALVKLRLANNAANSVGPWCLGVNDIFRLRNVYKAATSTVNTNSTNVTNEFFIDHNQTENIYNLGYLVKKPNSSLVLDETNDYLLVEFDSFVKSGDGVYSVYSYTRNDTAGNSSVSTLGELSLSTSNVHTLEIPEMYTSRGEYFDLRDTIDFRVNANNSANLVYTHNDVNITTNPAVKAYADAIDRSSEKYFPEPEGDLTFDVVKYEGRTDMIVLTSNGNFSTVTGPVGVRNKLLDPPENSILINQIDVKPYPSIPEVLSANTLEVLDKKISNIKYTNERQTIYKLDKAVSAENIEFVQPSAYRMSDIGSIDRRLKNIEYRIDLKEIEDAVKDLPIKSSVDATLNRFKFGFFVDNFTSTNFSETSDPEYSAVNFNNRLSVPKTQLNIRHKFYVNTSNTTTSDLLSGRIATLPYEEYTVVKQNSATTPTSTANTTVRQITTAIEDVRKDGPKIWDRYVTFSSTSGTARLYMGAFGVDRWEVYQSSSPFFVIPNAGTPLPLGAKLVTTSEQALSLTTEDRNRLSGIKAIPNSTVKGRWDLKSRPNVTFESKSGNPKYFIRNTGYVSWTHNPADGLYYLIRVIRGTPYHDYRLEYPVDAVVNVTTTIGPPSKIAYNGSLKSLKPKTLKARIRTAPLGWPYFYNHRSPYSKSSKLDTSVNTVPESRKSAVDSVVNVEIRGLKPNTLHDFYFGEELLNNQVTPTSGVNKGVFGTNTVGGSKLISDANGVLQFKWYYSDGLSDVITRTEYVEAQRQNKYIDVHKVVRVKSLDEISFANWTMKVDYNKG